MASTTEPLPRHTDLFVAGADGINTYRIPSLIVAPAGELLAFCEARKVSPVDASPTDLVMRRSNDAGDTWEPMRVIVHGTHDEAMMNPCPVVDGDCVLLFYINAHKTSHGHHKHLLIRSQDSGMTWSAPTDITASVGNDTFIPGPGVGVRMRSGRLVIPGYVNDFAADGSRIASYSCVAFSDDHGRSWQMGQRVDYAMSNESQVVELRDGSLLLNWRDQTPAATNPCCRGTSLSRDGGETWAAPVHARALNAGVCQAGLTRDPLQVDDAQSRIVFSNPDYRDGSGNARTMMTVKVSLDDGQTWPIARLIHAKRAAYSCPAVLPDGTVALLYECGESSPVERLRLSRFTWNWLKASEKS